MGRSVDSSQLRSPIVKLAYFTFSALGPPTGVPDMPKKCGIGRQVQSVSTKPRLTVVDKI